ncbi:hypothetical protein NY2A_b717R [Paramecium bursaria Chlorella virus NY2A]|uniref:Uncharacterized protein b383R n=1 Tax=Paramecium bursaria Chlorella virus NY2A TaxID=46021 RepID=A7IWQ8_PBCVN|nr:hypothetical protein NY2A_b383R [Paramecium bursaria Chlorella virus NY2A]YP_001497913.1 hypothetical protein NY2A_b717R [Paramecium bursaria Chlorella virus NY2A]ABT14782.1 hypothetical protein NY2A_b383R [Paramecium bursaria Chlorella virus NY2A]ABT15116.1 hypothetical protein NY2A_b717R [Paramecium bursaria Chlorella virus NY2A]
MFFFEEIDLSLKVISLLRRRDTSIQKRLRSSRNNRVISWRTNDAEKIFDIIESSSRRCDEAFDFLRFRPSSEGGITDSEDFSSSSGSNEFCGFFDIFRGHFIPLLKCYGLCLLN